MSIPLLDDLVAVAYPFVAHLAAALDGAGGAATAIVVCTVALRLLLLPLTIAAVRGERSRLRLAPQMLALRQRYGSDPVRLRSELLALHQREGASPLAGLLPMVLQAPFFLIWYRVFTVPQVADVPNVLLAHRFLGTELTAHLIGGQLAAFLPLVLALVALGAVNVWRGRRIAAASGTPPLSGPFLALPFLSVASAFFLPLAAVLYIATTTAWSTLENVVLRRGLPSRS
jgi:YidC/Oxa1 family membrane protein insertase